jgi:hypothetical protein
VWAVSQPVAIPVGYANYHIEQGTIIAHSTFGTGKNQYLVELGGVCSGYVALCGTTGFHPPAASQCPRV